MKRPILIGAVFALTGSVSAVCFGVSVLVVAGILELTAAVFFCRKNNLHLFYYIYLVICLITMILVFYRTKYQLSKSFYEKQLEEYGEKSCVICGKVDSVTVKQGYVQVLLYDCNVASDEETIASSAGILVTVSSFDGGVGDLIKLKGALKCFGQPRNEGEFDVRKYYHSIGVDYRCDADKITIVKHADNELFRKAEELKTNISSVFVRIMDEEEAGVLSSVILGDKKNLDADVKKMYQISGIVHLLAISGLHISIIGMTLYRICRRLLSVIPAAMLSAAVMGIYLFITGNGISAFRAVIMFLIAICAQVMGRTYDCPTALALAGILLVADDGRVIMNSGFQLSFTALAGICFVFPRLSAMFNNYKSESVKAKMADSVLVSISVQLSTLPVILLNYYQFPVYGFLLNLIVIPLMSLVMISGILTGIMGLFSVNAASFFVGTAHYILQFYKNACIVYEKIPGAVWVTGKPEKWSVLLYVFILLAVLLYISYQTKVIAKYATVVLMIIAVVSLKRHSQSELSVCMLDVGQGDCIFVSDSYGFNCLFDGGSSDIKNVGTKIILPFLKSQGVNHLDYVFVSHSDTDHINGIIELIEATDCSFSINKIVLPDICDKKLDKNYIKLTETAVRTGIPISYASAGDVLNESELYISCIHPENDYAYESTNDYSAVYMLKYKEFKMLFTGDAEKRAESHMLGITDENGLCDVDVLKAGHHGSQGASSQEFISYIKPEAVLISCGIDNVYGHPHEQTLDTLKKEKSHIYITSRMGAVTIRVDGNKYIIHSFLKTND